MRKVILFNMATLDGFFAGPDGEIDWHRVDQEFNEFAIAQLNAADGLIFGRVTYQGMASYWPTDMARANDPIVADKMNTLPKIVFSRTLEKVEWNNTRLVKGNIAEEISKLKGQPGQDWLLFGSATLAFILTNLGLIDEYRVMVNPVVLGHGKPLFKDIKEKLNLKLRDVKVFRNGNVLLCYQPEPMLKPNPALDPLKVLVGEWNMELSNAAFLPNPSDTVNGTVSFEWLEEGAFLVMRMGDKPPSPPQAVWLIGRDESLPDYKVLYFDSRKVSRIYEMSFADGVWKMWRDAPGFSQRFQGTFSDDGNTITATWEKSFDGSKWEHDFDLTYTKIR